MFNCARSSSDALLAELIKKGINLIVPPRDDLSPGDLILSDANGRGARRASWAPVMGVDPSPAVLARHTFKSVSLKVSDKVDIWWGARIAGAMLAPLGVENGAAESGLASLGCSSLTMRLIAPAGSAIVGLDELLEDLRSGRATPNPAYEGRNFYIASTVWRARGIEFDLFDENGKQISITAQVANQLEADFGLKLERKATQAFSFVADSALIFGIEVRKIKFEGGLILDETVTSALRFQDATDERDVRGFAWLDDDNPFVAFGDEPGAETTSSMSDHGSNS